MRHGGIRAVGELHFHLVALAYADELTRHITAESPIFIVDAVGHLHHFFHHFDFYHYFGSVVAVEGRRHFRCLGHDSINDRQVTLLLRF